MLVLHFDINDTITAFDKTDEISHEHKCNIIIARSVYGKVINNEWIMNCSPNDIEHEVGDITFYDYAKEKYKNYKEITSLFTVNNGYGKEFSNLITPMLDSMNRQFLFESFTNLVDALDGKTNVKFVFRTFGSDGNEVLNNFKHKNVIQGYFDVDKLVLYNGITLYGLDEINDYIKITDDHMFIQEDYHHWNNNGKDKVFGKQLMGTSDFNQIFFDDNPCVHVVNNTNATFVKINTLQAMLDSNYYIQYLKKINIL